MEGKVKFFSVSKGYGFITGSDNQDYFFHISSVKEGIALNNDDEVKFTPDENNKGRMAKNVVLLEG